MRVLEKRWVVAPPIPPDVDDDLHGYPPILRQILYNRGYATLEAARQYLEAQPPAGTDPFNMIGMGEAVERIRHAIHHNETIAVYGDYDADGVTATALLVQALESLGAKAQGYIPNRFDEGYGLNNEALKSLYGDGVRLVITVDCGIRSLAEADFAHTLGLDMIISDHHHPSEALPQAVAIINPKQPEDTYPDKDLAGVGLAYKITEALLRSDNLPSGIPSKEDYLDLVALGTVADLTPLTGENRALVRRGLERIRRPHRQGVQALIGVSGLQPHRITATHIGFALGPRLNAAGRLDSALAAYQLLTTQDIHEAGRLAQQLEIQNRERQKETNKIQDRAEQIVQEKDEDALLLFAAEPDFKLGVVGLAASRLSELYYRPAIIAHRGEEYTRGSCRSIPEFHITQALDQCLDLLERYGGHAAAAGFTVHNNRLPLLIERLGSIATEQLSSLILRPTIVADIEIPLYKLTPEVLTYLDWLQPTGYGNHQAIFLSHDVKVVHSRGVGKNNAHLKLVLQDNRITYDAIAFRQGHWQGQIPPYIDLIYTFELNEYNGRTSLQLNVRDIKPAGSPVQ